MMKQCVPKRLLLHTRFLHAMNPGGRLREALLGETNPRKWGNCLPICQPCNHKKGQAHLALFDAQVRDVLWGLVRVLGQLPVVPPF